MSADFEGKGEWLKDDWLKYLESIHPAEIEMGLGRMTKVAQALDLLKPAPTIIVVGGTNGKGTTTALLGQLLAAKGLTSAGYNSPHIHHYNERINRRSLIEDGSISATQLISDEELCCAFAAIEIGRGDVPLTYFEFGTLAALWQIKQWQVDVALREVGLGGRLDAVNIVDTDLAIVTSVGLDHQDWLGDTLDLIGMEKAGIGRKSQPLICGQLDVSQGFIDAANAIGANAYYQGCDFSIEQAEQGWLLTLPCALKSSIHLPNGHIPYFNIASAITGLYVLGLLPDEKGIQQAVADTRVPGRLTSYACQYKNTSLTFILDVAHNAQAAAFLASQLKGCNMAVLAMLGDKEPGAVIAALPQIEQWQLASLSGYRGQSSEKLKSQVLTSSGGKFFSCHDSVEHAMIASLQAIQTQGIEDAEVLVIGSFLTVSAAELALNHIDGLEWVVI